MSSNAVFSLLKPQFNSLLDPNVKNKREITKQILLDLKGVNSSGKLDLSKVNERVQRVNSSYFNLL